MLIDLLNSSNYIMVNREAVRLFGLNAAVYCAELLNIYKKAYEKNKLIDDVCFKVDRKYITKQTSLTVADQLTCDNKLTEIGVVKVSNEDPDVIMLNIETFASLISCEDVKILNAVAKQTKVKAARENAKEALRNRQILKLKESVKCKDYDTLVAIRDWIDSVMSDPTKFLSVPQIEIFTKTLLDFCGADNKKAIEIVNIAITHQYVDCQWAINNYIKNKQIAPAQPVFHNTERKKVTKANNLGKEVF